MIYIKTIAGGLAIIAGAFSGSKTKASAGNVWADVKCPNELL